MTLKRILYYLLCIIIVVLPGCTKKTTQTEHKLNKQVFKHFFSSTQTKDSFTLELLGNDILSGNMQLTIHSQQGDKIYQHQWEVSHYFSMPDNHYLNEEARLRKFWQIFNHSFDENKFSRLDELKVIGLLKSSDEPYLKAIMKDTSAIGFSFIEEDYCLMYSREHRHPVLLRALRVDFLKKRKII